ncbi:MAG: SDR family oxidoreductase, partial [Chlorobiales bacterium]|nr:SDR family oxidoreductase [Chlorobiales bacterium]
MPQLNDMPRVALVTGGAARIGRAIAEALAADGWAVAVHHRDSGQAADELVADIADHGGRAVALQADFRDEAQVAALVGRAVDALGPVGCLINNAAVFDYDDLRGATRASWDSHMEVNLRAPFVLTQAFAAALPERTQGCIINMIDQRVWSLTPYFSSYTVSKAGLWTLTQTTALALAPRIRVNAIGPGPALPSARQTAEQFAAQCARTPLGRDTPPAEISAGIRFILAAPSLTGQMIALDSGQHLGWTMPS